MHEEKTRTALVLGAGGFIGSHLVKRLKREGYWVRGADLKDPEWSRTEADEFITHDLRNPDICSRVIRFGGKQGNFYNSVPHQYEEPFDEIYQLAADMGGMGYLQSAECDIMHNNSLVNINILDCVRRLNEEKSVNRTKIFFSSSACVYRNMKPDEAKIREEESYPAMPDNEYGWEKLYAERMILAYGRRFDMPVRIVRLENCYGPEGTWQGGREKAPAAISRKVAEAKNGETIEVWGDGKAIRSFTYIDDIIDGIRLLMKSNLKGPVNLGSSEYVTVNELVSTIIEASGKRLDIKHIEGPVGVEARRLSNAKINSLGWKDEFSLKDGISLTYPWILSQVEKEVRK